MKNMTLMLRWKLYGLMTMLFCVVDVSSRRLLLQPEGSDIAMNSLQCHEVKPVFLTKRIATEEDIPDEPVSGSSRSICGSRMSCCTPDMEAGLEVIVSRDLREVLVKHNTEVKSLLATQLARFTMYTTSLIEISEDKLLTMFDQLDSSPLSQLSQLPIIQLYGDLAQFFQGHQIHLESSVLKFFDSLFPLVYARMFNRSTLSEEYIDCLRSAQLEIMPFGEVPSKLASKVARTFEIAKVYIQALHLGIEVINTTDYYRYADECYRALTRLSYCPKCQGFVEVKPCRGYCSNVLRGCLGVTAELDHPWNNYLEGLESLTRVMQTSAYIEGVLKDIDKNISTAMRIATERPNLGNMVKARCGSPQRAKRAATPEPVPTPVAVTPVQPPSPDLPLLHPASSTASVMSKSQRHGSFSQLGPGKSGNNDSEERPETTTSDWLGETQSVRLGEFVGRLRLFKNLYNDQADMLCTNSRFATRRHDRCWNGDKIGEYTKTTVGVGLTAQRYNPEMSVTRPATSLLSQLGDKLRHIRQTILSKLIDEAPESDSLIVEDGSGSGSQWETQWSDDDDDFYDRAGSGSGDGYAEIDDIEGYERPQDKDKGIYFGNTEDNTVVVIESGVSRSSSFGTLIAMTTIVLLYVQVNG